MNVRFLLCTRRWGDGLELRGKNLNNTPFVFHSKGVSPSIDAWSPTSSHSPPSIHSLWMVKLQGQKAETEGVGWEGKSTGLFV